MQFLIIDQNVQNIVKILFWSITQEPLDHLTYSHDWNFDTIFEFL